MRRGGATDMTGVTSGLREYAKTPK